MVGHMGRFCPAKNQSFILDIFYEIRQKGIPCKLFLAGEGEQFEEIKQKAKALGVSEHVIFAGYRNDPNCILQAFDVLLLPSLYEGLPIVAIEAQASGLPCLLADTITAETAVTDLVEFMSLTEPPRSWAERLTGLAKAHQKSDRSKYAQDLLENGYNIEETVKELETFLLTHKR